MDSNKKDRGSRKRQGPLSPKVRANELPLLQKGSASVSLAVSRILRDTSSIVAALSKRHLLLRLASLIGRAMRPRSADYFRKIGSTANQREWTRIRKVADRKKAGTFVPKGPRE
jgi:hypothetical protein